VEITRKSSKPSPFDSIRVWRNVIANRLRARGRWAVYLFGNDSSRTGRADMRPHRRDCGATMSAYRWAG